MHFGERGDGAEEGRGDAVDGDGVAEGFDVPENGGSKAPYLGSAPETPPNAL